MHSMQIETGIFLHILGMLDSCQDSSFFFPEGDQKGRYSDDLSQESGSDMWKPSQTQSRLLLLGSVAFQKAINTWTKQSGQPLLTGTYNLHFNPNTLSVYRHVVVYFIYSFKNIYTPIFPLGMLKVFKSPPLSSTMLGRQLLHKSCSAW